jgi:hypothetical protein
MAELTTEQANPEGRLRGSRGGKRPGAGRKPNYLKRLGIKAITAAEILAHFQEIDLWRGLLQHKSAAIRLQTLSYLTDRRDGKARQAVTVTGELLHAHTVYRDPLLAALSQEELKALDGITRKLALPAPDAPYNQIESTTAIEVTDAPTDASPETDAQDAEIPEALISTLPQPGSALRQSFAEPDSERAGEPSPADGTGTCPGGPSRPG